MPAGDTAATGTSRRTLAAALVRVRAALRRRVRAVRGQNDRGDVVGWAIMIPLSIALFLSAVQAAMWYQARNMCQAAAQAGARAGSTYQAGVDAGSAAANAYLAQTADRTVSHAQVSQQITATSVTISCQAVPFTLLPLPGLGHVSQSATAARERFTT
jgi:hypothetical protein